MTPRYRMGSKDEIFSANLCNSLCTRCLERIEPKTAWRGYRAVEVCLWLTAFLWVPLMLLGIGYSLWRIMTRQKVCPHCGAAEFVPAESQRAGELLANRDNWLL